jgi:hypothetical protein
MPFASPLKRAQYHVRIFRGPIGKQYHMVAILMLMLMPRLDNDGAINAALNLQIRAGVIPVSATLADGKLIGN